jgi:hypothetical protein
MVSTLVIHRQLTSLAKDSGGMAQGLHKILPANSGGTPDKSSFCGNISLHEKNDFLKKTFDDPFAHKFHAGGNSPLAPALRLPCFDSCFSSSIGDFGRKFRLSGVAGAQNSSDEIRAEPLTIAVFRVINPYHDKVDDHDPDQQTPDGVPAGVVRAGRIDARRSPERV